MIGRRWDIQDQGFYVAGGALWRSIENFGQEFPADPENRIRLEMYLRTCI